MFTEIKKESGDHRLPEVKIKRIEPLENMKVENFVLEYMTKYQKKHHKKNIEATVINISEAFYDKISDIIDKKIAEKLSISKFEKGKLYIKTCDFSLAAELKFREQEIKNLLNSNKSKDWLVEKIIFR